MLLELTEVLQVMGDTWVIAWTLRTTKAVSYISDHKRVTRANRLHVLHRRTQEVSRERSTSVSVVSWKEKRGLLLS
jgi:hypothetical protein